MENEKRVEVVTEEGYYEGSWNGKVELAIYDMVTYGDLDSLIEKDMKAAGVEIIVVKKKE